MYERKEFSSFYNDQQQPARSCQRGQEALNKLKQVNDKKKKKSAKRILDFGGSLVSTVMDQGVSPKKVKLDERPLMTRVLRPRKDSESSMTELPLSPTPNSHLKTPTKKIPSGKNVSSPAKLSPSKRTMRLRRDSENSVNSPKTFNNLKSPKLGSPIDSSSYPLTRLSRQRRDSERSNVSPLAGQVGVKSPKKCSKQQTVPHIPTSPLKFDKVLQIPTSPPKIQNKSVFLPTHVTTRTPKKESPRVQANSPSPSKRPKMRSARKQLLARYLCTPPSVSKQLFPGNNSQVSNETPSSSAASKTKTESLVKQPIDELKVETIAESENFIESKSFSKSNEKSKNSQVTCEDTSLENKPIKDIKNSTVNQLSHTKDVCRTPTKNETSTRKSLFRSAKSPIKNRYGRNQIENILPKTASTKKENESSGRKIDLSSKFEETFSSSCSEETKVIKADKVSNTEKHTKIVKVRSVKNSEFIEHKENKQLNNDLIKDSKDLERAVETAETLKKSNHSETSPTPSNIDIRYSKDCDYRQKNSKFQTKFCQKIDLKTKTDKDIHSANEKAELELVNLLNKTTEKIKEKATHAHFHENDGKLSCDNVITITPGKTDENVVNGMSGLLPSTLSRTNVDSSTSAEHLNKTFPSTSFNSPPNSESKTLAHIFYQNTPKRKSLLSLKSSETKSLYGQIFSSKSPIRESLHRAVKNSPVKYANCVSRSPRKNTSPRKRLFSDASCSSKTDSNVLDTPIEVESGKEITANLDLTSPTRTFRSGFYYIDIIS